MLATVGSAPLATTKPDPNGGLLLINGGPVPKALSDHPQALVDVRSLARA